MVRGWNRQDIVGRRFNRLTAVEFAGTTDNGKNALWNCVCDCGSYVNVRRGMLLRGDTKSCGCLRKETASARSRKRPYEALYNKVKGRCARIGREFSLTYEDFLEFVAIKFCYYCGDAVMWVPFRLGYKKTYVGSNLDRLNSGLGYTKENCVVCCWPCNEMKQSTSYSAFMSQIGKIYERHS